MVRVRVRVTNGNRFTEIFLRLSIVVAGGEGVMSEENVQTGRVRIRLKCPVRSALKDVVLKPANGSSIERIPSSALSRLDAAAAAAEADDDDASDADDSAANAANCSHDNCDCLHARQR